MPSAGARTGWDWSDMDVAVPRRPGRLPGISMAGFRQRVPASFEIAMVPHPAVTVFFDLGDAISYGLHGRRERGSVVVGLLPGDLRAGGRSLGDCLQVRLEPAVAATIFGPAHELSGTLTALDDVWGNEAARVEDRLRAADSWDERFALLGAAFRSRLNARTRIDPEVAHVWRRTRASRGRLSIESLADEVGWSRKRLWSRYRAQLGITPKRAAQLVRFDHAAHLLASGRSAAAVAATSGYVDQSHLHRESRALAGLTPSAVAAAPFLAIDPIAWPIPIGDASDRRRLR